MDVFLPTLEQMSFLLTLILTGYVLRRIGAVPNETASVLSKLENMLLVPALVLGTFMNSFTVNSLSRSWQYVLGGTIVVGVSVPIAVLVSKLCSRDPYTRKMYTYGLSFSNFGFMGNAVVMALFPTVFPDYLIFVIPLWFMIYAWGVPVLLIPNGEKKKGLASGLKVFVNPMLVCMLVGMLLGITGIGTRLPHFLSSSISTLGNCMSPVAMLLTGMTVAEIDLKKALGKVSIYVVSVVRLILIPIAFIGILSITDVPYQIALCTVCSVAMPLGLNTIVIPKAYDLDSTVASGMALISHVLSCVTIPIVFMIFELLIK